MSLKKRGQRWVIDYYPRGRKGRRSRISLPVGTTDDQAREYFADWCAANRNKDEVLVSPGDEDSVSGLLKKYLEWYRIHRAETTCKDLGYIVDRYWNSYFGPLLAENVTLQHVETYKRIRKEAGGKNRSINKELAYFSGFLRWCEDQGVIKQRQFKIRNLPYKRPIPIVLTFEEVTRIVDAAKPFYRALFLALYTLGLRKKEAEFIRWEDIDEGTNFLKVKQKGGGDKVLPMNDWFRSALDAIRPAKPEGYIFLNRRTKAPVRDLRRPLKQAVEAAKVTKKVTPHLFRHSIATHLIGRDVDVTIVGKYLGHSQLAATQFYTHVSMENLKRLVTGGLIDGHRTISDISCLQIEGEVEETK